MSDNSSTGVINAAKQAGTDVAVGTFNTLGAVGKIASSASSTTAKLVDVTGKTAVGVTSNLGAAAVSGAKILSSTTEAISTTTERMANSTKEMAKRRAEIERQKTADQMGKTQTEIAQIESNTKVNLTNIQNKYDEDQAILKSEQEAKLDKINSQQTQALLNQKDNTRKQNTAYYYGFTKSNPGPNDIGFNKSSVPFSKWCYSYIPQYFVAADGSTINIYLPETMPNGQRPYFINAIDNNLNQNIQIVFESQSITNMFKQTSFSQDPVIKYAGGNNIKGKMYYNLIWFVCDTYNGGKRRKTKRRTANRRTNKRRTNRRRTNRRR